MNNTKQVSFFTNVTNRYKKPKKEFLQFSIKEKYEWTTFSNHIFYETYGIVDELNIVLSAFDRTIKEIFSHGIPRSKNIEDELKRASMFDLFIKTVFGYIERYNGTFDHPGIVTVAQKAFVYELYRDEIGYFCKHYKTRRDWTEVFEEVIDVEDINSKSGFHEYAFRVKDKKLQELHKVGLVFKFRKFQHTRQELNIVLMCIDKFKNSSLDYRKEFTLIDNEVKEENQKFFNIIEINKKSGEIKGATSSRMQRAIIQIYLNKKYSETTV